MNEPETPPRWVDQCLEVTRRMFDALRAHDLQGLKELLRPRSRAMLMADLFGVPGVLHAITLSLPEKKLALLGVCDTTTDYRAELRVEMAERSWPISVVLTPCKGKMLVADLVPGSVEKDLSTQEWEDLHDFMRGVPLPVSLASVDAMDAVELKLLPGLTRTAFAFHEIVSAVKMWHDFKKKYRGRPGRKREKWSAAVEYAMSRLNGHEGITGALVAAKYGVAEATVWNAYGELNRVLKLAPFDDRYCLYPNPVKKALEGLTAMPGELGREPGKVLPFPGKPRGPLPEAVQEPGWRGKTLDCVSAKKWGEALRLLEGWKVKEPGNPEVYDTLAQLYEAMGDNARKEYNLRRAAALRAGASPQWSAVE